MSKAGQYNFCGYNANGWRIAKFVDHNFDVGETRVLEAFKRLKLEHGHIAVYKDGVLLNTAVIKVEPCE